MDEDAKAAAARTAVAPDGTALHFDTHGDPGHPALFLGPHFYATRSADDDAITGAWIDYFKQDYFVLVADYPRGFGRTRHPQGLTYSADCAAREYECIADEAGVERFGWVGYSFGAAMGIQVACRTGRVSALAIGGFPPLNAPFRTMTDMAAEMIAAPPSLPPTMDPALLLSAVGFYSSLLQWPERTEVSRLRMPRLVFMGDNDSAEGCTRVVPLADYLREAEGELQGQGWQVHWLQGHDHGSTLSAPELLPRVKAFFAAALPS